MYTFTEYHGLKYCDRCIAIFGELSAKLADYEAISILLPEKKIYFCLDHKDQIESQLKKDINKCQ